MWKIRKEKYMKEEQNQTGAVLEQP